MIDHPMHECDSLQDCAVAPSPNIRTYRPDPRSKRRLPDMTSTKTGPPPRPLVVPRPRATTASRPQARSAGTAERAGRNESLTDMVRFFQSQNMPSRPAPPPEPQTDSRAPSQPPPPSPCPSDTTTALPVAVSPKESKPDPIPDPKQDPKPDLKPFHRRLLQFAQRPKKEPSHRSKEEDQKRQIEALTKGGYLIPAPLPNEPRGQNETKRSKENLPHPLSRSLSKSKRDVENIGQPWLQAIVDGSRRSTEARRHLASLDLGDFDSMVGGAVSLASDFDDSVPPPYQPTDHASSQSPSTIPTSRSMTDLNPQHTTRATFSSHSTSQSYRNVSIDEHQRPSISTGSTMRADNVSRVTINSALGVNGTEPRPRLSIDSQKRTQSGQSSPRHVPPSTPTLKLFPAVAPPRKPTKGLLINSSIPRYQTIANTTASPASPVSSSRTGSSDNVHKASDEPKRPSVGFIGAPTSEVGPRSSGALAPRATSSSSSAALSRGKASKHSASHYKTKTRPLSLSLGTMNGFPLPAPTRPLPSLPVAQCSTSIPATNTRSIRTIDSGSLPQDLPSPSTTLVEDQKVESAVNSPCILTSTPATALSSVDASETIADDEDSFTILLSEHYQPTPEHCIPRGRVSSVRIPRVQELPERPSSQHDKEVSEGRPLADSPVLGHSMPGRPIPLKTNGKRVVPSRLQIDPHASRTNLPFGLPSPPPTASLPLAPPQRPPPPPPGRKVVQGNYTAPNLTILPSSRNMEVNPRVLTISRSNSSGSSLRHESFPTTHQQARPDSSLESPLPSSDDEVFGLVNDTKQSCLEANKYQRVQPQRRAYETMDPRQVSSHNRLRYPNAARPMTPQSRNIHNLDKTSSPQSQYSQSTHRSRESQGSQNTRAAPQADQYLQDRVANLERQNQILQAALIAALNAGAKNPLEDINRDPNTSSGFPRAPFSRQYSSRQTRPDSWVGSSRSSEYNGFESSNSHRDTRAKLEQLDNMIQDIESGWMSEKSIIGGNRIARKR